VGSVTRQLPEKKIFLWLHFLPILSVYVYLIPFLLKSAEDKIQVYRNEGAGYELFGSILFYAIIASGIIYVIWSSVLLKRHRRNILNQFSDVEKISLGWLQFLTWGMGALWVLVIFAQNDFFIYSGAVIFVFLIGFFGIRQEGIFTSVKPVQPAAQAVKYSRSGLNTESAGKLYNSLIHLMKEEGLFRKSDLTIGDLAEKLDVHPNYVSQVINEKESRNFYDFVNNFRIGEFKRLVAIPENRRLTLLSIALDCGFNSKSSFNRHFKKATGQTPSEYYSAIKG
jgi:AraC-like DNA-binding protein